MSTDKPLKRVYLDGELIAEVYNDDNKDLRDKFPLGEFVIKNGERMQVEIVFKNTGKRVPGVMWRGYDVDMVETWNFLSGETLEEYK